MFNDRALTHKRMVSMHNPLDFLPAETKAFRYDLWYDIWYDFWGIWYDKKAFYPYG